MYPHQTPFQAAQVVQKITDDLSERISDTVQEQMHLISPPPVQEHATPFMGPPMYYPPPFCSPATPPFPVQPQMHQTPPQETANVVTQNDIATIINTVVQIQQQTLQQMHGMLTNLSNTS